MMFGLGFFAGMLVMGAINLLLQGPKEAPVGNARKESATKEQIRQRLFSSGWRSEQ